MAEVPVPPTVNIPSTFLAPPTSGLGSGPEFGAGGRISYNVAGIEEGVAELQAVATRTEQNWQNSVNLVAQNPDHFGGSASDAFAQVMAHLNHDYQNATSLLSQARVTLEQCLQNMLEKDAQMASNYISSFGW